MCCPTQSITVVFTFSWAPPETGAGILSLKVSNDSNSSGYLSDSAPGPGADACALPGSTSTLTLWEARLPEPAPQESPLRGLVRVSLNQDPLRGDLRGRTLELQVSVAFGSVRRPGVQRRLGDIRQVPSSRCHPQGKPGAGRQAAPTMCRVVPGDPGWRKLADLGVTILSFAPSALPTPW